MSTCKKLFASTPIPRNISFSVTALGWLNSKARLLF
jgi:hypothetical protein